MSLAFPASSYEVLQLLRVLEQQSKSFAIKGSIALSAPIADTTQVHEQQDGTLAITQTSFTLGGVNGSLPEHMTELLHQRVATKDRTLLDFLDVFHHPLLLLLYQGWKQSNFAVAFEQQPNHPNGTTATLASSTGLSHTFIKQQMRDVHRYFAGLFSHRNRPGTALQQILSHHFNLPVSIEYFSGKWANIDPRETTRLSSQPQHQQHNQLGVDCLAGKHTWLTQNHFTLTIGPLNYAQYCRLLPCGDIFAALQALAQDYTGDELTPNITLTIEKLAIPSCQLNRQNPKRLGWTTWLKSPGQSGGQSHIRFGRNVASTPMH